MCEMPYAKEFGGLGSVRGRPDRGCDPVQPGDGPHSWYGFREGVEPTNIFFSPDKPKIRFSILDENEQRK